jgi:UDP-N-acetylmuramoyl-tripeptide--D-alanyl-D-alanine ligase
MWVPDVPAAVALVTAEVQPGDVVLVKGSRAVGLEALAQALLDDEPGPPA